MLLGSFQHHNWSSPLETLAKSQVFYLMFHVPFCSPLLFNMKFLIKFIHYKQEGNKTLFFNIQFCVSWMFEVMVNYFFNMWVLGLWSMITIGNGASKLLAIRYDMHSKGSLSSWTSFIFLFPYLVIFWFVLFVSWQVNHHHG